MGISTDLPVIDPDSCSALFLTSILHKFLNHHVHSLVSIYCQTLLLGLESFFCKAKLYKENIDLRYVNGSAEFYIEAK